LAAISFNFSFNTHNSKENMINSNLDQQAKALRLAIIELSRATKTPHIGSALSCCDMLLAAYSGGLNISPENVNNPTRDRLVLSKGHCASALVCTLAMHGFYPMEKLFDIFNRDGGIQEHPNYQCIPGVENSSGSLGHGLPLGLGMAMASNIIMESGITMSSGITQTPYRVCVIMGDGECNEGSVWEAALLAAAQKVNNLCVIIDFNGWQGTGKSCDIMAIAPLADKWRAFGWETIECDGHDIYKLKDLLTSFGKNDKSSKPLAIIAHTIKGKGVSIMEDDNNWHYRIPNDEEMAIARKELSS